MRTVRSDMNGRNDCGFRSQIVRVIVAPARDADWMCTAERPRLLGSVVHWLSAGGALAMSKL